MSFAEYLKGRISEDYKNLIIQKLEEIKSRTEQLKNTLSPSLQEIQQSFKSNLQQELARIQETLETEIHRSQGSINSEIHSMIDEHVASWYYSDVSEFEQQQQILISDIISNVPLPPKKKNADLESLAHLLQKLDQGNTQAEILNIVLQQISEWVDRAVLFVVRGDQATGWAALGLGADWDASRVRQISVDLRKETILQKVLETGTAAHGSADHYPDNGELFLLMGSTFPQSALACPVMVRGKIAGILYADIEDDLSDRPDLPNLLYLAARSAGFVIDLLPLKPKTIPIQTASAAVTQAVETKPPVTPAAPVQAAVPPAPSAAVATEEEPEVVDEQMEEVVAEPAVMEESKQAVIESKAQVEEPYVESEEPEEIVEEAIAEEDDEPATVMMPAPTPPVTAPVIITEQEQKLHDDAKRFARLLVSEIKLYNEAQVSAGREHKDLYDRLKDDIERSRRMYQERVPEHIHTTTNYFYEELVRTLANGDPTLLGM